MYLLLLYALARCREGKPAVDVLPFSRIHNLFLVILSLTLSYGVWSNVVRFYSSWLNVNIEVLEEARRHNDPSTNQFNWWELYLSPWYSLCCHRWCTMQPHVKDSIAAGTVSAEVAASWCPDDANPISGELYWWLYVTYLFKYYDMVDTILLVLKGKLRRNNVNEYMLHLFHHATVPLCAWMGFKGKLLMPLWMGMGINNVVHGTMYLYYFLRSIGYIPWWRRYLTALQTSQFALGAVMTIYGCFHFFKDPALSLENGFHFTPGCDADETYIFSCAWFNLAFLGLFMHWYRREYLLGLGKKKAQGKVKECVEAGAEAMNSTCTPDVNGETKPHKQD